MFGKFEREALVFAFRSFERLSFPIFQAEIGNAKLRLWRVEIYQPENWAKN